MWPGMLLKCKQLHMYEFFDIGTANIFPSKTMYKSRPPLQVNLTGLYNTDWLSLKLLRWIYFWIQPLKST